MARDGWTHVATLLRADEAELLRGLLESAGIDAVVEDGAIAALNPLWQSAIGGAKVLVPAREAARAAAVISGSGVFPGSAAEPVEIPEEEWSAARPPRSFAAEIGEVADGGERAAGHAFRSAFVALALAISVVVPLYALLVSIGALRARGPKTPRARRRAGWALVVSAVALGFGLMLWATVVPGLRQLDPQDQLGRFPRRAGEPAPR